MFKHQTFGWTRIHIPKFWMVKKSYTQILACKEEVIYPILTGKEVGLVGFLRIYVDLAVFQPYLDLEAGDLEKKS